MYELCNFRHSNNQRQQQDAKKDFFISSRFWCCKIRKEENGNISVLCKRKSSTQSIKNSWDSPYLPIKCNGKMQMSDDSSCISSKGSTRTCRNSARNLLSGDAWTLACLHCCQPSPKTQSSIVCTFQSLLFVLEHQQGK